MNRRRIYISAAALCAVLMVQSEADCAVSSGEAAALRTTLTPFGAERAGNADGSIPAWDGGMTSDPDYKAGGRRDHLFAGDKPLYAITAANLDQYKDLISEGTKAMFAAYPDSYRMDVYKTVRSAAAPQWVYENTFKNATTGELIDGGSAGLYPVKVYGGIPFPIPRQGAEVIWNHQLTWRGVSWDFMFSNYLTTSNGSRVLVATAHGKLQSPYYYPGGNAETFMDPNANDGAFSLNRILSNAPPIRAGEEILQRVNVNADHEGTWVYLTGQRRVRKLPNACCDTPHPTAAGVMSFDEIFGFYGRTSRFDWTLVGKKELYVPYNGNQTLKPPSSELLGRHHLNPDWIRWEKHRVWVVDATLKPGVRHVSPKGRYYFDEDSWNILQVDRYDAKGNLWKAIFQLPFMAAEQPVLVTQSFGFYDLISKTWFIAGVYNDEPVQYPFMPKRPETDFVADSLAGEGIR